jgi:hypothetical protein
MPARTGKYRPRRINQYCPAMGYHAGVIHAAPYEVNFGPMAVADDNCILNDQDISAATSTTTFLQDNTDPINSSYATEFPNGPGFGRCLQIVASGASTAAVTIKGRDYLGQPMVETFTLNGATPVVGVKAFKWIDLISWAAGGAVTMDVGTTDKLGLPYRMANVLTEELTGVRVATLGTLVTPNLTDPQTATTTDPRGTYDPQSTLNGTAYLSALMVPNGDINSSGNGGLHGLAHYYA